MPGKRARRQQRALKRQREIVDNPQDKIVKHKLLNADNVVDQPLEESDHDQEADSYEGILHEGHMFLKDTRTGLVYDSIRDEQGDLCEVGVIENGVIRFSMYDWKLPELEPRENEDFVFAVTDDNDHCETGIKAYLDIKEALELVAKFLHLGNDELRIWDPYYCTGRVKRRLLKLGFPLVHNANEDFYAAVRECRIPSYDILITNPPYSQDHIPRLLEFCANDTKPNFLLVPTYVLKKTYYKRMLNSTSPNMFLAPRHGRYSYHSPKFSRSKTGRTAPFKTIWIIFSKNSALHRALWKRLSCLQKDADWNIFGTPEEIPARYFDDNA